MAITRLDHYVDVQAFIAAILTANHGDATNAPHGVFWSTLTYQQFVNGNVPGVTDPTSGQPMRILVRGDSRASNIILALRGAPGTAFDPATGAFGPMPADGSPPFTSDQINSIADWIDRGCPE